MWCGGSRVRVARTTKDAQMLVGGCETKQGKMRTRSLNRHCGKTVQHVCSCVKSFCPIMLGKGSLNQQNADDMLTERIISSALPFCGDV
jgi:hypothetical protein